MLYRVMELNVTQIWIEWAGWLAFGCMAKFSLSGLRFIPSPGKLAHQIVQFGTNRNHKKWEPEYFLKSGPELTIQSTIESTP